MQIALKTTVHRTGIFANDHCHSPCISLINLALPDTSASDNFVHACFLETMMLVVHVKMAKDSVHVSYLEMRAGQVYKDA